MAGEHEQAARDPKPERMARPFRIEHWASGGVSWCLVVAMGLNEALALSLSHDASDGTWQEGRGLVAAADLRAPREALALALERRPASRAAAARFGLPKAGLDMTRTVHVVTCGDLGGAPPAGRHAPLSVSLSAQRTDRAGALGYEGLVAAAHDADHPRRPVPPGPRDADVVTLPASAFGVGQPYGTPNRFAALYEPAREFLLALIPTGPGAVLPLRHWSPEGETWYAARGEPGLRRRQAGGLYPALSPMIAFAPRVRAAVDQGRPFESTLAETLASCLPRRPDARPREIGTGLLRRLRTLPGDVSYETLAETVDVASDIPLDWLPTTEPGWRAFLADARGMARFSKVCGLPLSGFARDRRIRWSGRGTDGGATGDDWLMRLDEAADMARRAAQTLVEPLLDRVQDPSLVRVAGRILFGGLSSSGIVARSTRWHGELRRFEDAVPSVSGACAWPALFQPYEASSGLRIVALVDAGQLADEGGRYRDPRGAMGLNHCVGGYARDCYGGTTHVASVRRVLPGGGYERVSTLELVVERDGIRMRQNRGRMNALPSREASDAAEALLEALATGAHPIDPDALKRRSTHDFGNGIVRTTPLALARALGAWRPYLPRSAPRDDVEAMRTWVAARAAEADA